MQGSLPAKDGLSSKAGRAQAAETSCHRGSLQQPAERSHKRVRRMPCCPSRCPVQALELPIPGSLLLRRRCRKGECSVGSQDGHSACAAKTHLVLGVLASIAIDFDQHGKGLVGRSQEAQQAVRLAQQRAGGGLGLVLSVPPAFPPGQTTHDLASLAVAPTAPERVARDNRSMRGERPSRVWSALRRRCTEWIELIPA